MNVKASIKIPEGFQGNDHYLDSQRRVLACQIGEKINEAYPAVMTGFSPDGLKVVRHLYRSVNVYSDEELATIRASLGCILKQAAGNDLVAKTVIALDRYLTNPLGNPVAGPEPTPNDTDIFKDHLGQPIKMRGGFAEEP